MLKLLPNRTSGNIFTAISIHVAIQQTFITLNRFGNWAWKPGVKLQISIWIPGCLASMVLLPMKAAAMQRAHSPNCVRLFETPWTTVHQVLWVWNFSGKNTGVAHPFPSSGKIPDPGIKPASLAWQANSSLLSDWGSIFKEPKKKKKNRMGLKFTRSINNFLALQ